MSAIFLLRYRKSLLCIALLAISFFIYLPGLEGNFLLDDYGNLDKLGDYNGIRNFETFIQYLSSGIAGPTGRPISLLSFVIDSSNWPADPYPFKRTNLIIHGLNGLVLFFIVRLITSRINFSIQQSYSFAFITSALWLWHPFQVSTVLYVVQRMAMLSTLFSLLGILLYCYGRQLLISNTQKAYQLMTAGVVLGTVLAVFSKENGALLPLLILCIEVTIFSNPQKSLPKISKRWFLVFLAIPSTIIIVYLLSFINIDQFDTVLGRRDFSQKQRLLTESRLIVEYLYHFLIPQMFYNGVFNESIQLSNSLFAPPTTLPSILLIIFLVSLAFWLRKKQPFLALAILFFFSGHLLESTTISLELYFEHRNYLPSLFLFLPVAVFCQTHRSKILQGVLPIFLLICIVFTYNRASLWGNPTELTLFWAKQNQHSARAQRTAALTLTEQGRVIEALALLTAAKKAIPDSLDIKLHRTMLQCSINNFSKQDLIELNQAILQTKYTSNLYNLLAAFVDIASTSECSELNPDKTLILLDSFSQNPSFNYKPKVSYQFNHLKGLVYLRNHQAELAYNEFDIALNKSKRVSHGFLQAGLLATFNAFELALKHLNTAEKILPNHRAIDYFSMNYAEELKRLKEQIEQDAKKAQPSKPE